MIKNYIKIALRNIINYPGYSVINIAGLALGLACCFLIMVYVQMELSFDEFHKNKEQLHRLVIKGQVNGKQISSVNTPAPLSIALENNFPEIETTVRYTLRGRASLFRYEDENIERSGIGFADKDFFNLFTYKLLRGEADKVLNEPFSIVLTNSIAKNIFGDKNPVGETLVYNDKYSFTITGVMEDLPANTHFNFNYLANFYSLAKMSTNPEQFDNDFSNWNYSAYFKIKENTDYKELSAKSKTFYKELMKSDDESSLPDFYYQPISAIHFDREISGGGASGNIMYIYAFSLVALFVLLIACFNFMNMATARASHRLREVGIRKVLGAIRKQLVFQFLGESIFLSLIAVILAMAIIQLCINPFNSLMNMELSVDFLQNYNLFIIMVATGILTGIFAGSYPAFYLSGFKSALVLKNSKVAGGNTLFRKILISAQLVTAFILIMVAFTVYLQISFMKNHDLGFEDDQVMYIYINEPIHQKAEAFRNKLLNLSEVQQVSLCNSVPGNNRMTQTYYFYQDGMETNYNLNTILVDPYLKEILDLEMIEGRFFSEDIDTDLNYAYVVNETAAKLFGLEDLDKASFRYWDYDEKGKIIGIVKDFHFRSLQTEIEPLVMRIKSEWSYVEMIKLNSTDLSQSITKINEIWAEFAPGYPFDYRFLDADFENQYKAQEKMGYLLTLFTGLAIFIACLGLFGLASFTAEQRKKEIGVRKVLGASVGNVLLMLSRDLIILLVIAFIIASPLSWYFIESWLADFAYRINIGISTFLISGLLLFLVSWVAISFQSLKAATSNPVKALKNE